jgi:hypothetical protein
MSQGTNANRNGNAAEVVICAAIQANGFQIERQVYICQSIYGRRLYADIIIKGLPQFRDGLIVESKWQSSSGSIDEKYPYLVLNIKQMYPLPTMIIADGGGASEGAIEWLMNQVDDKLVAVLGLVDFMKFINRRE